jgi:hypothetical protein
MASRLTEQIVADILAVLDRNPDGATANTIQASLSAPAELRKLQRWLNDLVAGGALMLDATVSPPRYRRFADAAPPPASATQPVPAPAVNQLPVVVAIDSKDVRDLVTIIVQSRVAKSAVKQYIRQTVAGLPNAADYIAAVEAAFAGLGPHNVADYGLTAQQYVAWNQGVSQVGQLSNPVEIPGGPVDAPEVYPTSSPVESAGNPAPERRRNRARPTANAYEDDSGMPAHFASASPTRGRTSHHAAAPAGAPVIPGLNPSAVSQAALARDVAEIAEPLKLGELLVEAKATIKATITRARAAVAVGWGILVWFGAQQAIMTMAKHMTSASAQNSTTLMQLIGLAAIPVAGLPCLFFRWRDRQKAGTKLTGTDITVALVAGGILSTFAAKLALWPLNLIASLVM